VKQIFDFRTPKPFGYSR